jgi:hypothetical protein
MRKLHWLLGITAGCAAVGFVACGGSSSDNNNTDKPVTDSGAVTDATQQDAPVTVVDAGADAIEDSAPPPCVNDADLSTITVPDAALGDAGASVGTCLACTKSSCGPEVQDCQDECECRAAISDFYGCLAADGGSLFGCASGLAGGGGTPSGATAALGQCVLLGCSDECGLSFPKDGGKD